MHLKNLIQLRKAQWVQTYQSLAFFFLSSLPISSNYNRDAISPQWVYLSTLLDPEILSIEICSGVYSSGMINTSCPPVATPADLIRIILYRNGSCVFFWLSILLSALLYPTVSYPNKEKKRKEKRGREGFPENGLKNGMKTAFFFIRFFIFYFSL